MERIKLPGSKKNKIILLIVLVVIVISILVKTGISNKTKINNNKNINTKTVEKITSNKSSKEENNKKENNENEINEKEESMYKDAFNTFHNGDYASAISKADAIISEFNNSYKGYNIRGIAKAYNGNFQDGMSDINKALEIKPDYGYARFNKALNYELYGYYDEALSWYAKDLEVEEYLWTYYGIASIYGRRGDVKNTISNLSKALEIADKENIKDSVKEEAQNEADFDNVRDSTEFQSLVY